MPDQFDGTKKHFDKLRACLIALHKEGIKSPKIITQSKLGVHRTTLDRFRRDETDLHQPQAERLWIYLFNHHHEIFDKSHLTESETRQDQTFRLINASLDIGDATRQKFKDEFIGQYEIFSKSEIFFREGLFVRSILSLEKSGNNSVIATEEQSYDGRFGLSAIDVKFSGGCIPKNGLGIVALVEIISKSPRLIFIEDAVRDSQTRRAKFFSGFIVAMNGTTGNYFKSNFCGRRILSKNSVKANIINEEEINDGYIKGRLLER